MISTQSRYPLSSSHQSLFFYGSLWVALLFLMVPGMLWAQTVSWQPTNGPFGGTVTAMITSTQGDVLAGTQRGMFLSDDDGRTWQLQALPDRVINVFRQEEDGTLYAGTSKGIHQSVDGGHTWSLFGLDATAIQDVIAHPNGTFFATALLNFSNQLYRSTDFGKTWQTLQVETEGSVVNGVQLLAAGRDNGVYLSGSRSLLRSNDNGDTWCLVYEVPVVSGVASANDSPSTVRALLPIHSGDSVLVADNFGVRVVGGCGIPVEANNSDDLDDVNVFYRDQDGSQNTILAGTKNGEIYRSRDEGLTWRRYRDELSPITINAIAAISNGELIVGTGTRAAVRSTEHRGLWEPSSEGINRVATVSLVGGRKDVAFAGTTGGLFKTTDGGLTWRRSMFPENRVHLLVKSADGSIYVGAEGRGGVVQMDGDGLVENMSFIGPSEGTLSILPLDDEVFVSRQGERKNYGSPWDPFWVQEVPTLMRSTDGMESWDTAASNLSLYSMAQLSDGSLLARAKGLVRSTDRGTTWMALATAPDSIARSLHVLPDGTIYAQFDDMYLRRSDDNGKTWTTLTDGLRQFIYQLAMNKEGTLYASINYVEGIYQSKDHGTTWEFIGEELPEGFNVVGLDEEGYLYAGGSLNNVFRSTGPIGDVREGVRALPLPSPCDGSIVALEGVFPNHLAGSATGTLSYVLCEGSEIISVRVDMFNVRGELVGVIYDGVQKKGKHQFQFNLRDMTSGVYFFRVVTPDEIASAPFVLVR